MSSEQRQRMCYCSFTSISTLRSVSQCAQVGGTNVKPHSPSQKHTALESMAEICQQGETILKALVDQTSTSSLHNSPMEQHPILLTGPWRTEEHVRKLDKLPTSCVFLWLEVKEKKDQGRWMLLCCVFSPRRSLRFMRTTFWQQRQHEQSESGFSSAPVRETPSFVYFVL